MALETTRSELGNCERCGQRYRMPRWGREYSCARCGQPLAGGPPAAPVRARHVVLTIGILVAAGLGARVVADRIYYAPAMTVPTRPVPQPVTLPPNFEARLHEKIRLLASDLRANPPRPVKSRLLARQVECYLALTAIKAEERRRGTESLALASRALRDLRALDPEQAALLEADVSQVERLVWAPPDAAPRRSSGPSYQSGPGGMPHMSGALPAVSGGAGAPSMSGMPGAPGFSGAAGGYGSPGPPGGPGRGGLGAGGGQRGVLQQPLNGTAHNAPADAIAGAPAGARRQQPPAQPSLFPVGGGNAPAPSAQPGPSPAQMPLSGFPGGPNPAPMAPPAGSGADPAVPNTRTQLDAYLKQMRQRVKTANDDGITAVRLGQALERRAEVALRDARLEGRDASAAPRPYYLEAARVYTGAAGKARLRVHRGTYYSHAADVYGDLRDHEMQYRMRKKAVEAVPFDPGFWSDLQRAAQLTGRERETYIARQRHQEWLFPVLQVRREP